MQTTTSDAITPGLVFLVGLIHNLTRHVALVWLGYRRLKRFVEVGHISGLFYYPLKSGRGIELKEAIATGVGLSYDGVADRHWMIVDQNQAFLSQRKEPRIVLMTVNTMGKDSQTIRIEAPEMEPLLLPKSPCIGPDSKILKCRIFSHWVNSLDCGDAAAEWVSTFLKRPNLRLVFASDDLEMAELVAFSEDPEEAVQPGDKVAFADFASYLIVNQTSVDYVNAELEQPVNVLNYRPNIVIGGCQLAFEEDTWLEVRVGKQCLSGNVFRCLHLCSRCVMTTVDRDRGVKHPDMQPLKSLKTIRGVSPNKSVKFGVNATLNGECHITIGDPVYVLFR